MLVAIPTRTSTFVSIFIVITCRLEFTSPWSGRSHVTLQPLNRLGRQDCGAIADSLTGGKGLPDVVRNQIVDRTDGVPLFVEELTKSVLESGVLEEGTDRFELTGEIGDLAVPVTLQDSLEARLDRLASVKDIAQIGSVIGRVFRYGLLAEVTPIAERELNDGLTRLVQSELVFCRGQPPDATYTFKHALVQDTAYGSLLRGRRQELHAKVARTLERRFPELVASEPEVVAHHFTEGGQPDRGAHYWLAAGQAAQRRSAVTEARAHISKGLETVAESSASPTRTNTEIDLNLALAAVLRAMHGPGHPDVASAYERAQDVCGDERETNRGFTILHGQYLVDYTTGDLERALVQAETLLKHAGDRTDRLVVAHLTIGETYFQMGDSSIATDYIDRAIEYYDPEEHASLSYTYGRDFGVYGAGHKAWNLFMLGYPDSALSESEKAVAAARHLGQPHAIGFALVNRSELLAMLCDPEATRDVAQQSLTHSEEQGFAAFASNGRIFQGWAMTLLGQPELGCRIMEEGIAGWRGAGFQTMRPWHDCVRAQAYLCAGDTSMALAATESALKESKSTGRRLVDSLAYSVLGEVRLVMSVPDISGAENAYLRSIDIAQSQSAKSWELRAATRLARLWHSQGKTTEARDLLAPVYDWFTEGFDTADLKEAKALLDELN